MSNSKKTIVVIDNDEMNIKNITKLYMEYDIKSNSSFDINEAISYIEEQNPVLIFVNIGYGDRSAIALISAISNYKAFIITPLIALIDQLANDFSTIEAELFDKSGVWDLQRTPVFREYIRAKTDSFLAISEKMSTQNSTVNLPIVHWSLPRRVPNVFILDDESQQLEIFDDAVGKHFDIKYRKKIELAQDFLSNPEKTKPDLICIDIYIDEEIGGFKFHNWIKAQKHLAEIPVVFTSSEWNGVRMAHCIKGGACDFIRKPFALSNASRLRWHLKISNYLQ